MSEKNKENLAMSDKETMSDRLESLIKMLKIKSANQFAERIGVTASVINNVVSGRRGNLSVDTIQRIAEHIPRVNTDWLITGRGEPLRPLGDSYTYNYQSGNSGNTVGVNNGGSLSQHINSGEDLRAALAACQQRNKELEAVVADKQMIIDLLKSQK